MPINMTLQGAYYSKGRLVLAGQNNGHDSFDAALLLTALRAACRGDDPYFSLDADNGAAWMTEGREAFQELWRQIEGDFKQKPNLHSRGSELNFRSVSARRDYPIIWNQIFPKYPDLQTRLVFKPEWLRYTRFGEIMYKADVLIKELAGGVPTIDTSHLRADGISRYVSSDRRGVAKSLLSSMNEEKVSSDNNWSSYRLWFDLTPSSGNPRPIIPIERLVQVETPRVALAHVPDVPDSPLRRMLKNKGIVGFSAPIRKEDDIAYYKDVIDISAIYPKLYVRRHDQATRQDLPGNSPDLTALADDVSRRIELYVNAYKELSDLTEAFRAYVLAVHIAKTTHKICQSIGFRPTEAELTISALPEHYPTNLFITVGSYQYTDGRLRKLISATGASFQGGVKIGAREFISARLSKGYQTSLTKEISAEVAANHNQAQMWQSSSGRQFVSFVIDPENYMWPSNIQNLDAKTRMQRLYLVAGTFGILLGVVIIYVFIKTPKLKAASAGQNLSDKAGRNSNHVWAMPDQSQSKNLNEEIERKFNLVFSDRSRVEKEQLIAEARRVHGGTRGEAMQCAMDQWRKDNNLSS